jgi:hypothetical protein
VRFKVFKTVVIPFVDVDREIGRVERGFIDVFCLCVEVAGLLAAVVIVLGEQQQDRVLGHGLSFGREMIR